jgi:hypothetical protein
MEQSEDIRIIWKTQCKWRDTDYYVKQEDVWPIGSCKNKSIKGDAVWHAWYNTEIVEIKGTTRNEGSLPLLI